MKKRGVNNGIDLERPVVPENFDARMYLAKQNIANLDTDNNEFEIIDDTVESVIEFDDVDNIHRHTSIRVYKHKYNWFSFTFKLDDMLDDAPKHTRRILRLLLLKAGINKNYIRIDNKSNFIKEISYINNKGEIVSFNDTAFYNILKWLKDNNVILERDKKIIFNHNYIIFGNYNKFISDYLYAYGNKRNF